ncbi:MAG TPA: hypothetical protein VKM36_01460 [Balneolaceae bacterium]|nr:hypothetical protein [Balneolaceae bacterium]
MYLYFYTRWRKYVRKSKEAVLLRFFRLKACRNSAPTRLCRGAAIPPNGQAEGLQQVRFNSGEGMVAGYGLAH